MIQKEIGVGIFGVGTVGSSYIEELSYCEAVKRGEIKIKGVVRKDPTKPRPPYLPADVEITDDKSFILDNPDVHIILDFISGPDVPEKNLEIALEGFKKGKHFITASKHLLAEYYHEIYPRAWGYRMNIACNAAVGGRLPVIKKIQETPFRKEAFAGILNGTTNYMLTKESEGMSRDEALLEAQRRGFAEKDPSFDVDGVDAAEKLAICAMHMFHVPVDYKKIYRQSINEIEQSDIKLADNFKRVIKPLAIAELQEEGLQLSVGPQLIPKEYFLAAVDNELNAAELYLEGDRVVKIGPGYGAGRPTGLAALEDTMDIIKKIRYVIVDPPPFDSGKDIKILNREDFEVPMYIRIKGKDVEGVNNAITSKFLKHKINIFDDAHLREDGSRVPSIKAEQTKLPVDFAFILYPRPIKTLENCLKEIDELTVVEKTNKLGVWAREESS